jgi:pyruvate/2-oxoglutarate dehydrogenase complex dihydrolipoamide acyltransferase (E2) component
VQDIVSQTSWDEFLEIRSRVFLMQHEATPRASQDAAAQQQQQRPSRLSKEQQHLHHQQQQDGVVLVAALQQKLEQLGLQASSSVQGGTGGLVLHQSVEPPSSDEPATNGTHQQPELHGPAAAHATPPSRGRMSSSGGHKGSPKSYVSARAGSFCVHVVAGAC